MSTKIVWTQDERQEVIAKALEVMHTQGLNTFEALRLAQKLVLPTYRLRPFATHSAAVTECRMLKAQYSTYVQSTKASTPQSIEQVVTPAVQEKTPPAPLQTPPTTSMDEALQAWVQCLAQKIAASISTALQTELKELDHVFKVEKHNPAYESKSVFKKRIVVVGLLPDQAHHIEKEFESDFAFTFVTAEDAKHAAIVRADAYLIMKNFVSHVVTSRYQKCLQYVLIDGGMTTLRMWLQTKGATL